MYICYDPVTGAGCETPNPAGATTCRSCGASLAAAISLHDPGTLVGPYRVVGVLGWGGFGAVYTAEAVAASGPGKAITAGQPVALKQSFVAANGAQFARELAVLRDLDHPGLPRYYEVIVAGGASYLVMELAPGQTLREALALKPAGLPPDQVLGWALQLCDTLTYLHDPARPILHRDVKPANIRLSAAGTVKLVDFGLFKAAQAGTRHSQRGLGTVAYAPLEQYGAVGTTPASDIYSLGATLYHLLTGQEPPSAIARAGASSDPLVPVRRLRPGVPERMAVAIERALALRPAERYQSAAAFREALAEQPRAAADRFRVAPARAIVAREQDASGGAVEPALRNGLWLAGLIPLAGILVLAWVLISANQNPVVAVAPPTATVAIAPTSMPTPTAMRVATAILAPTAIRVATAILVPTAAPAAAGCQPAWMGILQPGGAQGRLYAVAATGANDAWAVGEQLVSRSAPSGGGYGPLTEHWDGSTWQIVTNPDLSDPGPSQFNGVVALASDDVWAVGSIGPNGVKTLIEHWDGTRWRIVGAPNPGMLGELNGVAAVGRDDIWAVGWFNNTRNHGGGNMPLALHWDGTDWQQVPIPDDVPEVELHGVSARAADDVWAVGSYWSPTGGGSLMAHWDGRVWKVQRGPSGGLLGVALIAKDDAWAVGSQEFVPGGGPASENAALTLILHWDGQTWRNVPSPNPGPLGNDHFLAAVQARRANDVWAVGYSPRGAIVLHWDGQRWVDAAANVPVLVGNALEGLAFAGPDVLAVGSGWASWKPFVVRQGDSPRCP